MARLRDAIGGAVFPARIGIERGVVPVSYDVGIGGSADAGRKVYGADTGEEELTLKEIIHWKAPLV